MNELELKYINDPSLFLKEEGYVELFDSLTFPRQVQLSITPRVKQMYYNIFYRKCNEKLKSFLKEKQKEFGFDSIWKVIWFIEFQMIFQCCERRFVQSPD